jgi:hypothetical protein
MDERRLQKLTFSTWKGLKWNTTLRRQLISGKRSTSCVTLRAQKGKGSGITCPQKSLGGDKYDCRNLIRRRLQHRDVKENKDNAIESSIPSRPTLQVDSKSILRNLCPETMAIAASATPNRISKPRPEPDAEAANDKKSHSPRRESYATPVPDKGRGRSHSRPTQHVSRRSM